MQRQEAETIIREYMKPIFGFMLKRCANEQDAEDLTQEIVLRAFRALLTREDIADVRKFIWTIAHNGLSNYYRDSKRSWAGVSLDEIAEVTAAKQEDLSADLILRETTDRLQREIAYLSQLQRRIVVAYYYENKKQSDIAAELGLPLGTIKWHLFEAKKELKKGMDTVRTVGELKFNPVRFGLMGLCGSVGRYGTGEFFRSALAQNIVYTVYQEAKTVREIADALGVSPVYVESEIEQLEENGFLLRVGDAYRANLLINDQTGNTKAIHRLQERMYTRAAALIANDLYEELIASGLLQSEHILCGYAEQTTMTSGTRRDDNYLLWSLIPYIAALSGDEQREEPITFDEVATIRPDGGQYIAHVTVQPTDPEEQQRLERMTQWCGPCWCYDEDYALWACDSQWSVRRNGEGQFYTGNHNLSLLRRLDEGDLSKTELARLAEQGFIKTVTHEERDWVKTALQIVRIDDRPTVEELLAVGKRVKDRHKDELQVLKRDYVRAVLADTPSHLRKVQEYLMQSIFYSDGWFLLYCMTELVNNGKLKPPTKDQKKSVTTLMVALH